MVETRIPALAVGNVKKSFKVKDKNFYQAITKEKYYVNFINLNPDDVDEIHEFDK